MGVPVSDVEVRRLQEQATLELRALVAAAGGDVSTVAPTAVALALRDDPTDDRPLATRIVVHALALVAADPSSGSTIDLRDRSPDAGRRSLDATGSLRATAACPGWQLVRRTPDLTRPERMAADRHRSTCGLCEDRWRSSEAVRLRLGTVVDAHAESVATGAAVATAGGLLVYAVRLGRQLRGRAAPALGLVAAVTAAVAIAISVTGPVDRGAPATASARPAASSTDPVTTATVPTTRLPAGATDPIGDPTTPPSLDPVPTTVGPSVLTTVRAPRTQVAAPPTTRPQPDTGSTSVPVVQPSAANGRRALLAESGTALAANRSQVAGYLQGLGYGVADASSATLTSAGLFSAIDRFRAVDAGAPWAPMVVDLLLAPRFSLGGEPAFALADGDVTAAALAAHLPSNRPLLVVLDLTGPALPSVAGFVAAFAGPKRVVVGAAAPDGAGLVDAGPVTTGSTGFGAVFWPAFTDPTADTDHDGHVSAQEAAAVAARPEPGRALLSPPTVDDEHGGPFLLGGR